jgi:hypothetical protein
MAALIGALSGLLIGPTTTVFYDSGFLIGLKGFVAAVIGGLPATRWPLRWAPVRRAGGVLWLVLGQCVQGGDCVHLHPADSAVALLAATATRRNTDMNFTQLPRQRAARGAGGVACLAVLPVPEFWITQLNYIGLYSLVILGLVLLTGMGGLTSFGQAAFVGIGAYTSAYLTVNMGCRPG